MLTRQVITHARLIEEGISRKKIKVMTKILALFPTPFKGIYYIPSPEERKSTSIDKPLMILTRAIAAYLRTKEFYYSCRTAEEFFGINWQPSGEIHIVNTKLSRKIDLKSRITRNEKKNNYRAKRIAKILSLYGREIFFHKIKSINKAKVKQTPYGTFALRSQIKKDKKKFREVWLFPRK